MKKKILVDFDSTSANSPKAIFEIYKEETKDITATYHTNYLWNFQGLLPSEYTDRAIELFGEDKFFDRLELMPNAYEVLKELNEVYDVAICSVHNIKTAHKKESFIRNNLPFIKKIEFIDYDGKFDKSAQKGDIIIDDKVSCLKGDRELKILFGNYGYNQLVNVKGDEKNILLYDHNIIRADNWDKVKSLLLK